MSHPEPAPCPSCDGPAFCYRRVSRDEPYWVVICDYCHHRGTPSIKSADDAIRRWNRGADLKPCPFCGTYPVVDEVDELNLQVRCPSCGSTGPEAPIEAAVTIWNGREAV